MNENLFFERLLEIPDIKVDQVFYESRRIVIECHNENEVQVCPQCGSRAKKPIKSYEERQVRDLDISGKEVWLHIRVKQFECDCGRYFHERFEWVEPGKSYTRRQKKFIFEMCARQPFSEVGAITNMNPKTVESLYYAHAETVVNLTARYAQVRKLGIDELAMRKGKGDYCCVLSDLERGIELDILADRKKERLIAHFEKLGPEFCRQIEDVCCDMWGPYVEVARQCFPQATVTIDRFHVVKALNEVMDKVRKALRKEYPQEDVFKELKWCLFKRSSQLTPEQCQSLHQAFELAPELEHAYMLSKSFHAIFDHAPNKEQASLWLEQWIKDVQFTENPKWETFLKTLNNWKDQILNFVGSGISNAVTEGLNNLIRYIKRISFAIPNFEHMRLRVLTNSA